MTRYDEKYTFAFFTWPHKPVHDMATKNPGEGQSKNCLSKLLEILNQRGEA